MKAWKNTPLHIKIFVLLIIGCAIGFLFGERVTVLAPIGDAYIKLLKMLIVPLVFFSIISGVIKLGSPSEFGQVGSRIILFYIVTTILAAGVGVVGASLMNPGVDACWGPLKMSPSRNSVWPAPSFPGFQRIL